MLRNILILIGFILAGFAMTWGLDHDTRPAQTAPVIAAEPLDNQAPVPDIEFTDINGQTHKISTYAGKVVILNFWASWCAPCVVEFPKLVELASRNENYVLIALSSDIGDEQIHKFLVKQPDDIKAKMASKNVIVARDPKGKMTKDIFQTYKLPETILIDRKGRMAKKIVGDTDWLGEDIKTELSRL